MLEAAGATLLYEDHGREVAACRDVSLRVEDGQFVGILGPSGSGKSSLLYLLSGLKDPTRGRISYEGTDLASLGESERARLRLSEFGFVFQQPFLLGYLSVLENVLVTVARSGESAERAEHLLYDLGLGDKLKRRPHELSGGERQRVCVARSLVHRPRVIFADEPTAALDHHNGEAVVSMLEKNRGAGALVMVTHDPSMLVGANRVIRLSDGMVEQD